MFFLQEEKEKARAQKDKVVTQVTEVMENELQCIICSELFIEVGPAVCVVCLIRPTYKKRTKIQLSKAEVTLHFFVVCRFILIHNLFLPVSLIFQTVVIKY